MKVDRLAPREREVAEAVFALGEASAIEIGAALSDPLSNSAVRTMLRRLEAKGVLRRCRQGKRFFYAPATTEQAAREAALRRVSREYFGGSHAEAAAALLALADAQSARARRPKAVGGIIRFGRYEPERPARRLKTG